MKIHSQSTLSAMLLLVVTLAPMAVGQETTTPPDHKTSWHVAQDGTVTLTFDHHQLDALGWRLFPLGHLEKTPNPDRITFPVRAPWTLQVQTVDSLFQRAIGGAITAGGAISIGMDSHRAVIGNLAIEPDKDGHWLIWSTLTATDDVPVFSLVSTKVGLSETGSLRITGDLAITERWAAQLGHAEAAGLIVGRLTTDVGLALATDGFDSRVDDASNEGGPAGVIGPDIIVGDLQDILRWPRNGNTVPYAIGTFACNIGDERASWVASTNQHPVIIQNMYRLSSGRFEQIGMSWAKHGFVAISDALCSDSCDDPTNGSQLGVGCADPYSATLNGSQGNLGPRWQVNASTGEFAYPWTAPPATTGLDRRLRVETVDLEPVLNPNARYYVEGHYVSADDAQAGNNNNNASYRQVNVTSAGPTYDVTFAAETVREQPAIRAWEAHDEDVVMQTIDVADDGRFLLGYKVTSVGAGVWHYEYAIQNLNSHRSARLVSIPVSDGAVVTNIDFHDIDTHSGSPYDTTDWPGVRADGAVTWETSLFVHNPNANALRWGSLFNVRFDADAPPALGDLTLGLFTLALPLEVSVEVLVPSNPLSIVGSNPPSGAIDARQPTDGNGDNPDGWSSVELIFNQEVGDITPDAFTITVDLPGPVVIIDSLTVDGANVTVHFGDPAPQAIPVGAWTTITHNASATSVRLGYLPADVSGDGHSTPVDILILIDALNGVGEPLPIWSTDTNRSGLTEPSDILTVIDLLNGAGAWDAYNGWALP